MSLVRVSRLRFVIGFLLDEAFGEKGTSERMVIASVRAGCRGSTLSGGPKIPARTVWGCGRNLFRPLWRKAVTRRI